ncbi:MAG: hypothetical protein DA408_00085 [Bacteroidetes bacterium]|nr:MAG: hypothetical protein C7N36_03325 [Bacteroidota bacterium]PTM15056.1 MAG: hypothetical protein DA408_00085 [Bacteroidota bacterium]
MAARINYWQQLEENLTYHIYNHAVGRENLFATEANYTYFLERWKKHMPYLDVYAYCLMPNHFHFLAKVKPLDEYLLEHIRTQQTQKAEAFLKSTIPYHSYLEDQFKRLFSGYTLAFNKQEENRRGTLFQKRFKRVAISSDYRLLYMLAYIHHNPIHHRFYDNHTDWPHSSYQAFFQMGKHSNIRRQEVLSWFADDMDKALTLFTQYHQDFKTDRDMGGYMFED